MRERFRLRQALFYLCFFEAEARCDVRRERKGAKHVKTQESRCCFKRLFSVRHCERRSGEARTRFYDIPHPRTFPRIDDVAAFHPCKRERAFAVHVEVRRLHALSELEHCVGRPFERAELLKMRFVDAGNDSPIRRDDAREFSNVSRIVFAELENQHFFVTVETTSEFRDAKRSIVAIFRRGHFSPLRKHRSQYLARACLSETSCDGDLYAAVRCEEPLYFCQQ